MVFIYELKGLKILTYSNKKLYKVILKILLENFGFYIYISFKNK